jgi:hypothetical protein
MWLEDSVHMEIYWKGVTVDGFRPENKHVRQMLRETGRPWWRYTNPKMEHAYCLHANLIKHQYHLEAENAGLARDRRCLTHFLAPSEEFPSRFSSTEKELEGDGRNKKSYYRIMVFQFPDGSCDVYKQCIENLLGKIGFRNKGSYRDRKGCEYDLKFITRNEIKHSPNHIVQIDSKLREMFDYWGNPYYYDVGWACLNDFSYRPFRNWYLYGPPGKTSIILEIDRPPRI